jgi:hypothetical protein
LEIGNNCSDLYIEQTLEVLRIAVKYDKVKRVTRPNSFRQDAKLWPEAYRVPGSFQCNVTGKSMLEFPFEYQPFWDKVSQ